MHPMEMLHEQSRVRTRVQSWGTIATRDMLMNSKAPITESKKGWNNKIKLSYALEFDSGFVS